MGVAAVAVGARGVRAPGQPRASPTTGAVLPDRRRRPGRGRPARRRPRRRPRRRRARGAAGRGRRRRGARPRAALLRSRCRRRAPRGLEGLDEARARRGRRAHRAPRAPSARRRAGAALAFLESSRAPYVVKTDGLAAGKGVVVTESLADARDAVRAYLSGEAFGDAGRTLVIEEGLTGPELSLLVVCNGDPDAALPLAPAQDFKRIVDGDTGPNTGGMGAYSPVPIVDAAIVDEVMDRAVRPTLRWLADARRRLPRRALRRDDAHRRRPQGHRVQRPLRRPRDARSCCPASRPTSPSSCSPRPRRQARRHVLRRRRASPSSSPPTATPPRPRTGDPIAGLDVAAAVNTVTVFHAGTTTTTAARSRTAGGRVLNSPPRASTSK